MFREAANSGANRVLKLLIDSLHWLMDPNLTLKVQRNGTLNINAYLSSSLDKKQPLGGCSAFVFQGTDLCRVDSAGPEPESAVELGVECFLEDPSLHKQGVLTLLSSCFPSDS